MVISILAVVVNLQEKQEGARFFPLRSAGKSSSPLSPEDLVYCWRADHGLGPLQTLALALVYHYNYAKAIQALKSRL